MTIETLFTMNCPMCGRILKICVEHLGEVVACQHCRGTFVAIDSVSASELAETACRIGVPIGCERRYDSKQFVQQFVGTR